MNDTPHSFHVRVNLWNAAFDGISDPESVEGIRARHNLANQLHDIAHQISVAFGRDLAPETPHKIRDFNGNTVGVWYTMADLRETENE